MTYHLWRSAFSGVVDSRLYTMDWLDRQVATGLARFMCTDRAAILTEFRFYPTGAFDIHGLIAAGNLDDIADVLIPEAEDFGRRCGAVGAIIESRDGWARVLKGRGYSPYQVALRKDL